MKEEENAAKQQMKLVRKVSAEDAKLAKKLQDQENKEVEDVKWYTLHLKQPLKPMNDNDSNINDGMIDMI
jgi:hypothetical protein